MSRNFQPLDEKEANRTKQPLLNPNNINRNLRGKDMRRSVGTLKARGSRFAAPARSGRTTGMRRYSRVGRGS